MKPIVDSGRRAVDGRTILPSAANFENVNKAADDASIIDAPGAGLVLRKKRLNRRPLHLAQPKFLRHDSSPAPDSA
jgi:hypothetical protein